MDRRTRGLLRTQHEGFQKLSQASCENEQRSPQNEQNSVLSLRLSVFHLPNSLNSQRSMGKLSRRHSLLPRSGKFLSFFAEIHKKLALKYWVCDLCGEVFRVFGGVFAINSDFFVCGFGNRETYSRIFDF